MRVLRCRIAVPTEVIEATLLLSQCRRGGPGRLALQCTVHTLTSVVGLRARGRRLLLRASGPYLSAKRVMPMQDRKPCSG
jgi:hypothetical protein